MHERIGVPSVETRSSWIIATVLLVILALSFGAPWITIVALKLIAAESDGLRAVPALATSLAWLGFGSGGIAMGYVAERIGVRSTVIIGAMMVCIGLALSTGGETWQLYVGQGLFVGFFRDRRHERAVLRLCQPLVRSPPRIGPRADFKRQLRRGRGLAADLRACRRLRRLASDHALLWSVRSRRGRPVGGGISATTAQAAALPRARPHVSDQYRDGVAPQFRVRAAGRRRHLLLHPDGHAAGASAGVLQRSRHPGVAWRGDAVGALGHGLPQPSILGLGRRSRGRARDGADGLGVSDGCDDGVHVHAG